MNRTQKRAMDAVVLAIFNSGALTPKELSACIRYARKLMKK